MKYAHDDTAASAELFLALQQAEADLARAVDELAGKIRAPQMMAPTRVLWAIEVRIRHTPLALVRHLAAIAGSVAVGF
ncbi:hypothetical protein PRJ_5510 (plasmid) [Pseudomonas sp. XWY-1]|nr:hypothetical protein PRJ_5510 [Pseudomonas sp. XWY-1]